MIQFIHNPTLSLNTTMQSGSTFIQNFIPSLINIIFIGAVVIFIFVLIIGAVQWISSGADKQNLEAARGKVTSAIIGIVTLFSLYAIIGLISYFFCVNLISLSLDKLRVTNTGTAASGPCPVTNIGNPGNGGGGVPGGGNTTPGVGVADCGCKNGGCAQLGIVALGNQPGGTTCNICTLSGWSTDLAGNGAPPQTCSGNKPITCYSTCK